MASIDDLPPPHDISDLPPPPQAAEPQIGTLGALGRGALHGATFGWSAPLVGSLEALSDEAFKNPKESLIDLYRKHRDESVANYEASEKQHPYASLIGNLLGAAAPAAITMGAAAAPEALAAGAAGGEALAAAAPGALDRALMAAKAGGIYGGIMGAGDSKSDLTKGEIGGVAKDALGGAAMGAVTGAALSPVMDAAAPVVQKGMDKLKGAYETARDEYSPEVIKKILSSYDNGAEGVKLYGGKATRQRMAGELVDLQDSLPEQLKNQISEWGQEQKALIAAGKPANMKVWSDNVLPQIDNVIANTRDEDVIADATKFKNNILNWTNGFEKTLKAKADVVSNPGMAKLNRAALVANGAADIDAANAPAQLYKPLEFPVQMPDGGYRPGEALYNGRNGKITNAQFQSEPTLPPAEPDILTNYPGAPQSNVGPLAPPNAIATGLPGLDTKAALMNASQGERENEMLRTLNQGQPGQRFTIGSSPDGQFKYLQDNALSPPQKVSAVFPASELEDQIKTLRWNIPGVRVGGFMDPDGMMDPTKVQGLKETIAGYGLPLDEGGLKSGKVRALAAQTLGQGTETNPGLQKVLEDVVPGLKEKNAQLSDLYAAQDVLPTISNLNGLNSDSLINETKLQQFLRKLPEDMRSSIEPDIRDFSEKDEIRKGIASFGLGHSVNHFIFGNAKSLALNAANRTGLVVNELTKATPDRIRALASAVVAKHGQDGQGLARALSQISDRDQVGRNAMMFAIQQNPAYRTMLNGLLGEDNGGK